MMRTPMAATLTCWLAGVLLVSCWGRTLPGSNPYFVDDTGAFPNWHSPPFVSSEVRRGLGEGRNVTDTEEPRPIWTAGCGVSKYPDAGQISSFIVGGEISRQGEWPWQAVLEYNGYFRCGAVLISDRWALTAAHCHRSAPASRYSVVLGEHDRDDVSSSPSRRRITAARIIEHPRADGSTHENDVALIELSEPVPFTQDIRPVCRPSPADRFDGMTCIVSGWGKTKPNRGSFSSVLRQVAVPVVTNSVCSRAMVDIFPSSLCAGFKEGGKDACQNDSGGPLVCKVGSSWRLAGVVSWGEGCAQPNHYGVYQRVTSYLDWIQSYTGF